MSELTPKQKWFNAVAPQIVSALKKRHFEAFYFESKQEAAQKLLSLIPQTDVVSWGGSQTLNELELPSLLQQRNYKVIDRNSAKSTEEREELSRKALLCDSYILSSNALTEDGQLFNIDGNGNRLGALIYGPKKVFVVVGMNKIVKTLEDAVSRVRNYAAPANHQRFSGDAPCVKTGLCANCLSKDSICAQMVTTRLCRPEGRITVILVGETLGL